MNLREEILHEHSKAQCKKIVDWVGSDPKRFAALMELFVSGEERIAQRAAWPLSYCVIYHPSLIKPYFRVLVENFQRPGIHNAVRRNTLRLLQFVEIPSRYQGVIMDLCFQAITDPKEKAAVKAFSLTILENLSRVHPDILPEIRLVIEERWHQETPAFKSRARKILKEDQKKIRRT